MSDNFLTAEEAALKFKISRSTLAKRRLTGDGPAYIRAGRKILYNEATFVSWLNGKTFGSTSEYTAKGVA